MKTKIMVLVIIALLVNLNSVALAGIATATSDPQPQSQAQSIERLKQEIQNLEAEIKNLEAVGKDPDKEAELKEMNRQFIQVRRSEYEKKKKLLGWLDYLQTGGSSLKSEERRMVEAKIRSLEQELGPGSPQSTGSIASAAPSDTGLQREVTGTTAASPERTASLLNVNRPVTSSAAPTTTMARTETHVSSALASAQTEIDVVKDCDREKIRQNPGTYSLYEKYVCNVVNALRDEKTLGISHPTLGNTQPDPQATISPRHYFAIALALIGKRDEPTFLVAAEEARTDKQVGAGPSASGTTSLVVKGSAPTFLGLAVENGALTQSISDTTITFRGNPVGILQALANRGYVQSFDESDNNTFLRYLKKFSFSFSFDTSRGNDQTDTSPGNTMPNVFTADKQQLSQVTARYEFYNQRDPRNKRYRKLWEGFLDTHQLQLTRNVSTVFDSLLEDPALKDWFDTTTILVREAKGDNVERVIKQQFAQLPADKLSPTTVERLVSLEENFEGYLQERKKLLDIIAKGSIVAFEYTNTRNVTSPNLSNFRLIAEKGPGGSIDATFNGSLTIFDKIPMGMTKRVRDFQFAGQFDARIGNLLGTGNLIFFLSGKYERLMENATDPMGMTVMDTKGDIGVGQVGIKIPIPGSGFRIPLSLSYSNRTELIKEKEVRGNIGFTFDLDTLFSKIKP